MTRTRKHPLAECENCPLFERGYVPGQGDPTGPILVGEGPGAQEVQQGIPFIGPSGQLLDRVISFVGGNPEATYRTNVVSCQPPNNRTPTSLEIQYCSARLHNEITRSSSKVVVALGKVARNVLLGPDAEQGVWYTPDSGDGKRFMASWHPAYVLRKPSAIEQLKRNFRLIYGEPVPFDVKDYAYTVVETPRDLKLYLETWKGECSFDFETNQINWHSDAILCLALAYQENHAFIVPDYLIYDEPEATDILRTFFAREDVEFIAHHGKFDLHFLRHQARVEGRIDFDTLIAHYGLVEVYPHDLKTLLSWYFGFPDYEKDLVQKYLRKRSDEYSKVPPADLYQYGAIDVCGTLRLKRRFERDLRNEGLYDGLFKSILMPATMALYELEHRGMAVDVEWLGKAQAQMDLLCASLTDDMRDRSHKPDLNPNSTQQMAVIVWDDMQLPRNRSYRDKTKTGRSTSAGALEHLASINPKTRKKVRDGNPFVDVLFEYRRIAKLKSSYIDNLVKSTEQSGTNRVHTTANVHGTEIGRLAFRNPALQTIPRADEHWGRVVRSSFVADSECLLDVADYAQAEWRVFAAESQDPFLIKVFQDERDLHDEVSIELYGADFTKVQRVMAKMFNFAWIYGGNEHSFAQDAGMPLDLAREWVRRYNKLMAVAVQWRKDQFKLAKSQGYVETRTGRRRRFPLITRQNLNDTRKASVHAVIAGGASDMTLLSLIEAEKRGLKCVLTVHDSILIEAPKTIAKEQGEELRQIMLTTASQWYPEVPWKVDLDVVETWVERPSSLLPEGVSIS